MTAWMEAELDLTRRYTEEERDALYDAIMAALDAGDKAKAERLSRHMPIHPRWAKIVAEVKGKQYLREHFNLSHADEVYGEGWLDGIKEDVWFPV